MAAPFMSSRILKDRILTHVASFDPQPTQDILESMGIDDDGEDDPRAHPKVIAWRKRKLAKFTKEYGIENVDILAIDTGHTEYLPELLSEMQLSKRLSNIAFIQMESFTGGDSVIYGKTTKVKTKNRNACRVLSKKHPFNCIAFLDFNMKQTFSYVFELGALGFCGYCYPENVTSISWYTVDGFIIAYVDVDTESG